MRHQNGREIMSISQIWTPDERRDSQAGLLRALANEAEELQGEGGRRLRGQIQKLDERRDGYERMMEELVRETDERRERE